MSPLSLSDSSGGGESLIEPIVSVLQLTVRRPQKKKLVYAQTDDSKVFELYLDIISNVQVVFIQTPLAVNWTLIIRYSLSTQSTQSFPHERNLPHWILFLTYQRHAPEQFHLCVVR